MKKRAQLACLGLLFLLLAGAPASAVEIEGVHLPDMISLEGSPLRLNGAGIRTKFFFDIYVCGLYLPQKTTEAAHVLLMPAPTRVVMHFLYREVEAEKLVHGWRAGFAKNQDAAAIQALKTRLERFNSFFADARRGDEVVFDFTSDGRTHVRINGREKGDIPGVDFQRALLAVWLGVRPADDDLKQALLGR